MKFSILFLALAVLTCACTKDDKLLYNEKFLSESNFSDTNDGWLAEFSDYPLVAEEHYELETRLAKLPAPLDQTDEAIFISGKNHSDDLFMYLKKKITKLKPNTSFRARFTVLFASNAPSGMIGVGGAPGESVYMGIGITKTEPASVIDDEGLHRMNIDKGHQATEGPDRKVIGDIANGTDQWVYTLVQREGEFMFTTDNSGTVWATVSTDSGFEGTTSLYYTKITLDISKVE